MPWNEPGKDKDPWGQKNNEGPPDLDEVLNNMKKKVSGILGGAKRGGGNGSIPSGPGNIKGILGLVIGAAFIFWILTGIYIVDEGTRGIETRFGAKTIATLPGPHWHVPWPIEDVEIVNVEAVRTTRHKSTMLTRDENIIALSLLIQYNVKDAMDYVFEVRDPDITLKQVVETAIREVVGNNDMDFALTQGRAEIGSQTKVIMQDILDSYKTGLNVVTVNMDELQPPEQVQDAFEDAIKAREDEQRIINEANAYRNDVVPKARGDAEGMLEKAEAYKTRVTKSAEGEASRFNQLLAEYQRAPEVTRERLYLDAMENIFSNSSKVLIDVDNGNNLMLLPLDKMLTGSGSLSLDRLTGSNSGNIDSFGSSSQNTRSRTTARQRSREIQQ